MIMDKQNTYSYDPIPEDCQLFLFDMGNVVVKNISMLDAIANQYNLDRAEFVLDYQHYNFPLMEGSITEVQYWQHIHHSFGVKVEGNPFFDAFEPIFNDKVVTLISALRERGHRVVCASNTIDSHWVKLRAMGALAIFDQVYASHVLRLSKPSKHFFKAILDAEQTQPQRAYFIDDYEENVQSARELGVACLRYDFAPEKEILHSCFSAILG